MRAAETNLVVRSFVRDDPHQGAAAETFIEGGAWVSTLALAEAVWVLATIYGFSTNDLARAISMLLNHRDFILQDADAVASALTLFRDRPSLGFSDCLILELARKAGHLPLGTFDRKLARVDGAKKL